MKHFDEWYLCAYLANKYQIEDYNTIYGLYNVIDSFSLKATNDQILQIKLQWIIDSLVRNIDDTGHPSLDEFIRLNYKYSYMNNNFIKIIETKSIDLLSYPFSSISDIFNYTNSTGGLFWYTVAKVFGVVEEQDLLMCYKVGGYFSSLKMVLNVELQTQRGIFPFIFANQADQLSQEATMKDNIKQLLQNIPTTISDNSKRKPSLTTKRLLMLHMFTKDYNNQISKSFYNNFSFNSSHLAKTTYLKLLIRYLLKI